MTLVKTQTRLEATKIIKETMTNIHRNAIWDGEKVNKTVNRLMDDLIANRNIIYCLTDIRAMNDYTFDHSITVCILAIMVGIYAGYNYRKLKDLGVGAILHDVGKTFVPDLILNKTSKLTSQEYLEIQRHTVLGYEFLKKNDQINSAATQVAWQHHERFDGGGYPRGLKGTEIHEFARIVALTDVYDALSTDRVYRRRQLPHEVIEYIRDRGQQCFDPDFSQIFLQRIAPFPVGLTVLLNTGEKAIVVKVSSDLPARPLV